MKLTLRPTTMLGIAGAGVACRRWVGETEEGHQVEAWIAVVGLDGNAPPSAHAEFEAALLALEPEALRHVRGSKC